MDRGVYTQPNNSRNVWLESGDRLFRSTDGGEKWARISLGESGQLFSLAADPTKPTTLYVCAEAGVYQTTDGIHFNLLPGSPKSFGWNNVLVDPVDPETIYSTCYSSGTAGVWRLRAGQWTKILDKPHARELAIDPGDTRRMAVITKDSPNKDMSLADGVWITEDDAQHWQKCNDGICVTNGSGIGFNPDKSGQLIIGTDGGGFYVTDLGSSTPRGGTPHNILRPLRAADYDDGPQGFNTPSARPMSLTQMKTGQWAKYTVTVPTTGYYNLTFRVASATGAQLHAEFNGGNVTGPVKFQTPSNNNWTDIHVSKVRLIAGDQYLCLYADTNNVNIDSLRASQQQ